MKFVKRLLVITAACAMILSLASCGNGDSNKATDTMKQTEPTSASDSAVTNEPSASDEIGNNVDDVKKQAEAIEESRESLRALIGKASTLSSEEDIAAWGKEFSDIKNDLEEKTKTLSEHYSKRPRGISGILRKNIEMLPQLLMTQWPVLNLLPLPLSAETCQREIESFRLFGQNGRCRQTLG